MLILLFLLFLGNLFIKCLKPYRASRGALPPWPPYQGFALDPLGALSGPQTPRPIILHPPFLIPGYGPGYDSVTALCVSLPLPLNINAALALFLSFCTMNLRKDRQLLFD